MVILTVLVGVSGALYEAGKDIFLYGKHKHDDVKELDRRYQDLTEQVDILKSQISMVEQSEIAGGFRIRGGFRKSVDVADNRIRQFEILKHKYENVSRGEVNNPQRIRVRDQEGPPPRYVFGSPLFFKLAKLSKDILELTRDISNSNRDIVRFGRDVENVMEQVGRWKGVVQYETIKWAEPEQVVKMEDGDEIYDVTCLNDNLEEILRHLGYNDVRKIGIWGMAGVGKTTLLKKLNNKMVGNSMFDIVIWSSVPEDEDSVIRKIQEDLIARLKLNLGTGDTSSSRWREQNAAIISKRLSRKKYLVILDGVSSNINLQEVGIIRGQEDGKVVFATRGRGVMEADHKIEVKHLTNGDAWELIQKFLGNIVRYRSNMREIAQQIVTELGGLPRLIKGMATYLKDDDTEDRWMSTLLKLQSTTENQQRDVQEMFIIFDFLFRQLKDETKKCLLYTASFPTRYQINEDNLVECWRAEQLIQDNTSYDCSFMVARVQGRQILKDLINLCLLERYNCSRISGKKNNCSRLMNCITVPQPFRRFAITTPCPEAENRAERICSSHCSELQQYFPKLREFYYASTLLLHQSNNAEEEEPIPLPSDVFRHMFQFRVLDFHQTAVSSLPSLFTLNNLGALYLNDCHHLHELSPGIGSQGNLEILDISGTGIDYLPLEIGWLYRLRCFRVSFRYDDDAAAAAASSSTPTPEKVLIPSNVIERLHSLEELTISVDPREQSWEGTVEDTIAKEMGRLTLLSTLCFYFPIERSLTFFIRWRACFRNEAARVPVGGTFRSFQIQVGTCDRIIYPDHELHSSSSDDDQLRRHLIFSAGRGAQSEIKEVLKQATAFELIRHEGFQSLSHFGMRNMESLEVCVIEECNEMTSIVDVNGGGDAAFPNLKTLHIANLRSLNCVFSEGVVNPESLVQLTILTLNRCPVLSKVFSHGIVQQLRHLRYLKVENCSKVDEIIEIIDNHSAAGATTSTGGDDGINPSAGTLPKLENLHLINLPSLTRICREECSLEWPSLVKIEINLCGALKNLSLNDTNAKQLQCIDCEKNWWDNVLQLDYRGRNHLRPLCPFGSVDQAPSPPRENDPMPPSAGPVDESTFSGCFHFCARPRES